MRSASFGTDRRSDFEQAAVSQKPGGIRSFLVSHLFFAAGPVTSEKRKVPFIRLPLAI